MTTTTTTNDIEHGAAWAAAATLAERIEALRAAGPPREGEVDFERARRRLRRWREQAPFGSDEVFARRLAAEGIDEDVLLRLLGESAESARERATSTPDWLRHFGAAFEGQPSSAEPSPETPRPAASYGAAGNGFLMVADPLLRRALRRFQEGVARLAREHESPPFDPQTLLSLVAGGLFGQTLGLLNRTMILELNVSRLRGELEGETPEARFESFVRRLSDPANALAILAEYPPLARLVTVRVEYWLDAALEFLSRLCGDWNDIRETFGASSNLGPLTEIKGNAGDQHREGRSVLIATFASGFRLVYKPKPLAVDVHLQQLLDWLNQRGTHPSFRTLKVLDRGDYGWVEFVAAGPCESAEEVLRFYQRQGGLLALLYALEATDFHFENLIAAGEHPVLIDLESLFHPRPEAAAPSEAQQLVGEDMGNSVLRVGLLPQRIWLGADGEGLDVSGLGSSGGQEVPTGAPAWEATGTDEMRVVRKRGLLPKGQNRPTLGEADVNLLDYDEAIVEGFESVYRTLLDHRDELLAAGGPVAAFERDEVRVILRPTKTYGQMLAESYHPDLLRDGLDRARFFDRLWLTVEPTPFLERVIPAELSELARGDIPMFTTRADSRDLRSGTGEIVSDFFKESGVALVRRRIGRLGEDDLKRQVWFIRASFTSLSPDPSRQQTRPARPLPETAEAPDRERLVAAAAAVGDRLERLAFCGADDASWLGLTLVNEKHWSLMPMGADLYGGVSGVALFLAYLGELTGEERHTALAMKAWQTVRRQAEQHKSSDISLGCFNGLSGLVYAQAHLHALWGDPALLAEAEEMVERVRPAVERDEDYDIIGGTAGCLAALLCLHRHAHSARALSAAVACGEHLLAHAHAAGSGLGWLTRVSPEVPLTGFSHGAAGIAWALLGLADETGETRFREAAIQAIEYERGLYSPAARNWPDLRGRTAEQARAQADAPPNYMCTWCHGAPGVGLARLHALGQLDDEALRPEVSAALATTLAEGFGANHSLCHGDLGNLDFVLQADERLADAELHARRERLAAGVVASIEHNGWLCGVPTGVETPGLMLGIAGIGYGLLRLADPARVPSLLTLAPPAQRNRRATEGDGSRA